MRAYRNGSVLSSSVSADNLMFEWMMLRCLWNVLNSSFVWSQSRILSLMYLYHYMESSELCSEPVVQNVPYRNWPWLAQTTNYPMVTPFCWLWNLSLCRNMIESRTCLNKSEVMSLNCWPSRCRVSLCGTLVNSEIMSELTKMLECFRCMVCSFWTEGSEFVMRYSRSSTVGFIIHP